MIDGLGFDWWEREWAQKNPNGRPHLIYFVRVQNSEVSGVTFLNSPMYTLKMDDVDSVYAHDQEIKINIMR